MAREIIEVQLGAIRLTGPAQPGFLRLAIPCPLATAFGTVHVAPVRTIGAIALVIECPLATTPVCHVASDWALTNRVRTLT